jgi:hypothetical protein
MMEKLGQAKTHMELKKMVCFHPLPRPPLLPSPFLYPSLHPSLPPFLRPSSSPSLILFFLTSSPFEIINLLQIAQVDTTGRGVIVFNDFLTMMLGKGQNSVSSFVFLLLLLLFFHFSFRFWLFFLFSFFFFLFLSFPLRKNS